MSGCHYWNTTCWFPPGVLLIFDKEGGIAVAMRQGKSQAGWFHMHSIKQNRYKRMHYVAVRAKHTAKGGSGRKKYLLGI